MVWRAGGSGEAAHAKTFASARTRFRPDGLWIHTHTQIHRDGGAGEKESKKGLTRRGEPERLQLLLELGILQSPTRTSTSLDRRGVATQSGQARDMGDDVSTVETFGDVGRSGNTKRNRRSPPADAHTWSLALVQRQEVGDARAGGKRGPRNARSARHTLTRPDHLRCSCSIWCTTPR